MSYNKPDLEQYIEEKKAEFEQIIAEGRWGEVQDFYKEMEDEGYGQYVPEVSEIMTDEDVQEYKKWDLEVNGDTETQML